MACNFGTPKQTGFVQTYNLPNKAELLALVRAPDGIEGAKEITLVTDQVHTSSRTQEGIVKPSFGLQLIQLALLVANVRHMCRPQILCCTGV